MRFSLPFVFLILSLGLTVFGAYGFIGSLKTVEESELKPVTGVVWGVSYGYRESGTVDSIRFDFGPGSGSFVIPGFYPAFEEARNCVVSAATVEVLADRSRDVWGLRCGGRTIATPESIGRAKRENGRWGLGIAAMFALGAGFWFWRWKATKSA